MSQMGINRQWRIQDFKNEGRERGGGEGERRKRVKQPAMVRWHTPAANVLGLENYISMQYLVVV